MDILELVIEFLINLLINLFFTVFIYLLVPIIIVIKKKKFTKQKIKRIVIFNGIGGFILFFIIYAVLFDGTANIIATFFWSSIVYKILMKNSCLDDKIATNPPTTYSEEKTVNEEVIPMSENISPVKMSISPENEPPASTGTPLSDLAFTPEQESPFVNTTPAQNVSKEVPPTQKVEKPVKMKFCSHCGAIIDNNTKVCTGCGKQYFKGITKRSIPIIILSVIIVAISTLSIYFNMQLANKVEDLRESIETKNRKIDGLNEEITELEDSFRAYKDLVDNHVALVEDDGTYLYHKFGCEEFKGNSYWIYNTEAAEGEGYHPCDKCHKSESTYTDDFYQALREKYHLNYG